MNASQTSTFTPPNRDDYVFRRPGTPWWAWNRLDDDDDRPSKAVTSWSLAGNTDATGAHVLHLDVASLNPAMPMSVMANATVTDVNRQAWSARAALIVHPSSLYVGLKASRPFVEQGQPFELGVIGVDLDGKPAPGAKIEVKASRIDWEFKKGRYQRLELDHADVCGRSRRTIRASAGSRPSEAASTRRSRRSSMRTAVPNQTKLMFWVAGGDSPPARGVQQERVQLIPDKKEYAGGDTAELLVQAPFSPAEAIVTAWRRGGIVKTEHLTMTGATTTIHVPVTDAMVPNIDVQVDLVGMAVRVDPHGVPDPKAPKRPAYASGSIDLSVPPTRRTLAVTVAPDHAKLAPGEAAKIAVEVRDAAGHPVPGAETAVMVVDEAVLALSGYRIGTPIDTFYIPRYPDARDQYLRSYIELAQPEPRTIVTENAPAARSFRGAREYDFTSDRLEGNLDRPPASPPTKSAPPMQPGNSAAPIAGALELRSARGVCAEREDRPRRQGHRRHQAPR